jgi:hypothetical protein
MVSLSLDVCLLTGNKKLEPKENEQLERNEAKRKVSNFGLFARKRNEKWQRNEVTRREEKNLFRLFR